MEGGSYFVADVHLGIRDSGENKREEEFCKFLDSLPESAESLYLLGDIFDFWVDYKSVVPRGFTRVFGRLALLVERGCKVYFLKGNHDFWVTDYFERELGIEIIDEPFIIKEISGRKVGIGHGDVLGCTDFKARLIFSLFRNRFLITLLKALPSSWVFGFATWWSSRSRKRHQDYTFDVEDSDIMRFAEKMGKEQGIDEFVFGHFHRESHSTLQCGASLHILGDWSDGPSYLNL